MRQPPPSVVMSGIIVVEAAVTREVLLLLLFVVSVSEESEIAAVEFDDTAVTATATAAAVAVAVGIESANSLEVAMVLEMERGGETGSFKSNMVAGLNANAEEEAEEGVAGSSMHNGRILEADAAAEEEEGGGEDAELSNDEVLIRGTIDKEEEAVVEFEISNQPKHRRRERERERKRSTTCRRGYEYALVVQSDRSTGESVL